ncbi:unnamed protein product [Lota lota]
MHNPFVTPVGPGNESPNTAGLCSAGMRGGAPGRGLPLRPQGPPAAAMAPTPAAAPPLIKPPSVPGHASKVARY